MDEGKREAATRKEEEQNAIPGRETRLTSVQKQEGYVGAGICNLVLPVWWRWSSVGAGQGWGPQDPLGSLHLTPRAKAFPSLQQGCCPKEPPSRLKAGPRALSCGQM